MSNPFKNMTVFTVDGFTEGQHMLFKTSPQFITTDPVGASWRTVGLCEATTEGDYFHSLDGSGWLCCVQFNERILPAKVRDEYVDKAVQRIEQLEGRKVGKKEYAQLRDEVETDLLPKAFIRRSRVHVILTATKNRALVFTSSAKKADDAMNLLINVFVDDGVEIKAQRLTTERSVVNYLTSEALTPSSAYFNHGKQAVLKHTEDQTIRVKDCDLHSSEIQTTLKRGYRVHEMAMVLTDNYGLEERVEFKVNENLVFKGMNITDADELAYDGDDGALDFHATAWMVCREYNDLVTNLIDEIENTADESEEEL